MSKTVPFEELEARVLAEPSATADIAAHKRAIEDALALAELRGTCGVTQQELAQAPDVTQSNVSRIEHEEDLYLSTPRAYVTALGGELEVTAVFPERRVALNGARRR
ncbi:MAG: helix-turn-helix domain-containing protein [Thermomicrobiales bacterium]